MRGFIPGYQLVQARDLDHALEVLSANVNNNGDTTAAGWVPMAGGTDLMVQLESARLPEGNYLSIWGVDALRGIAVDSEHVTMGALTTYADVIAHEVIAAALPLLVVAARETGAVAIQNRGTLGGNIINASPAADTPPALLAYDAEIELRSTRGSRWVRYQDFHTGYKQMDRSADELLTRIRVKRCAADRGWVHWYRKVGTRKFQSISKVCFAGVAHVADGVASQVRIGLGSVGPTPLLATATMEALEGRGLDPAAEEAARQAMGEDATPLDDIRSTAKYRSQVAGNLGQAFVKALVAGQG